MQEPPFTSRLSTARSIANSDAPLDPTARAVLRALIDRIDRALLVVQDEDGEYATGGSASDAVQDMQAILNGAVEDGRGFLVEPVED